MVGTEKGCVLAIDVSGSVKDFKFYWDQVEELLNDLLSRKYLSYTVVAWSSRYEGITVETLREYIKERRDTHGGGTCPDLVWDFLHSEKLPHYDLHLVTDGEIANKRYNRYIDMYYSLKHKPEVIYIYYFGRLGKMNMKFLDCFKNVQYVINGIDTNDEIVMHTSTKVDKDALFQQLCSLDEFKQIEANVAAKDLVEILQNLYKKLYRKIIEYSEKELNGAIGEEFKKFVVLINEMVHRNQDDVDGDAVKNKTINFIQNEMAKNDETMDEATKFDELFHDYKSNCKEIFEIFVKRFLDATTVDYKKVLQQIIELGSGQSKVDRRLLAYGENWYGAQKQGISEFGDNDDDDADSEQREEYGFTPTNKDVASKKLDANSNLSCLISSLDSSEFNKFCVVFIGIDEQFGGNQFHQMLDTSLRRKVAKSPMRLFEFLSYEDLKKRIPTADDHISIGAALGLKIIKLDTIDNKEFDLVYKSPLHQVACFGIVLYNADCEASFPADISQNEMNILSHNYATIAQLLFGDSKFNGSFPLLHTFFLQILNQQVSPHTKKCIEKTLERTSTILKCPFMLESELEPSFYSPLKNAILFHTDIYPNEIDKLTESVPGIEALNIPRKRVHYCSGLLDLAKNIFGVTYNEEYEKKLKLWRFWDYMLCKSDMVQDEKMLHFKQIALTKVQNWQPIESGQIKIMFIEGKSAKPYFDYLDNIKFDDIVKLIILFETTKSKKSTANISTENVGLAETDQWYNVKTIEKIDEFACRMTNVQFCKTTCAYPVISPLVKLLVDFCEHKKFNFIDQGANSSIILHSNYLQSGEDMIMDKSLDEKIMQIPTVDELKKYVVQKAPMAVYHTDIDAILENIIGKYRTWNNWYENANENEKKKYLWIDSNWKKIFAHKMDVKNNERLKACDCEAHQYLSLYSKLRSLNDDNPMIIYSILFIFIALIFMLFVK